MPLEIKVKEKEPGVIDVILRGNLDTSTYESLEKEMEQAVAKSPQIIVLDLEKLEYISSMGLRVIAKTKKLLQASDGELMIVNIKPHIKEVFDIVKALPAQQIFRDMDELDKYLIARQKIVKEGQS